MIAYGVVGSKIVKKETTGVVKEAMIWRVMARGTEREAEIIEIEADCRTCQYLRSLTAKQCMRCEGNNYRYNSLHNYELEL